MSPISTLSKAIIASCVVFFLFSNATYGQIVVYTNDTGGVMNMIATHVTADTLKRVNGTVRLTPPCTHGFSTKGFTNATSYSDTLEAVQLTVSANVGYFLKVDSFKADLRHSPTGPANARFAYSINGGTTWVDQGTDQYPYGSGTCDSMITCKWVHPLTLSYPNHLTFRVYGFNCSVTTGTGNLQIMNLIINGSLIPTTSVTGLTLEEQSLQIYPNPVEQTVTISYQLANEERVSADIYNVLGQKVMSVANSELQFGDHTYLVSLSTPGIYFVKLTIGDQTFTRKIVKL
jgi:Secretion system C-terminal sorting domain